MKRNLLFALLLMVAGIQTAWGQRQNSVADGKARVSLYVEGNKAYECDVAQLDSIVFSEIPQNQEEEEIVVTVDAYGIADGGHWFEEINKTNFYIDDIKYTVKNGDLEVSGYNETFFKGEAKIISKLKYHARTMDVVGIKSNAFENFNRLTSVTIPNSVTYIGSEAFYCCRGLTSVNIGNGVTSIGDYAFDNCSGLSSVTIPNSVTSIGDRAFEECTSLTSIKVEEGNTTYDSRDNCNAIIETATNTLVIGCKTTVIPNSVTSISNFAFYFCSGLSSVTIPNSVTSIGEKAFSGCSGLTSVTIGSGVTSISLYAFDGCSALTSVTIPNSVKSIGVGAFRDCSSLTSITIPNSVTSIGEGAFSGCSGLTSITIPNSVTSIGEKAFSWTGWYKAQPDGILYLDNWLIGYKGTKPTGIVTIKSGTRRIADYAFDNCSGLSSVTIPNSVTSIGNDAFINCSGLTSITIGNSVTRIGDYAFSGCSGLTDVYCYATNPPYAYRSFYYIPNTLHVPAGSINSYKAEYPWSQFESIVAIE